MTTEAPVPVAVIVLTLDEAANLERCLASVQGWVAQLFVVDSGSTDESPEIARHYGAEVVTHPFTSHADQWSWAFRELPLEAPWLLCLDADQSVSSDLRQSLRDALAGPPAKEPSGYYLPRRQVFRGRWIRHGGYYPKYLLKLGRRERMGVAEGDRVDHHFTVAGETRTLDGDLIEDNRNEVRIADWVDKHNRYAQLQAREELERLAAGGRGGRLLGNPDERTAWLKARWLRLPLYVRPFMYFAYRYVFRLGFLDGKQGLVFHFMQGLWYRLLVDINRDELEDRDL